MDYTKIQESATPQEEQHVGTGLESDGGITDTESGGKESFWTSSYGSGSFTIKEDGRMPGIYQRRKEGDESSEEFISKPVKVIAIVRDTENTGYGKLIEFVDIDGNKREAIIQFSDIGRDCEAIIKRLRDEGLVISSNNGLAKRLVDFIHDYPPPENRRIRFSNMTGWHQDGFLLPGDFIGSSEEQFVFKSPGSKTVAFEAQGTLEEWSAKVGFSCSGNPILGFSVSAAFAAPLLHLLEMENGGFHLVGDSSIGKSTALLAAASVFGNPSKGVPKWNATVNAMEGTAKAHNDMLLPLDEIGQSTGSHTGETVYMLGNGLGKGRSTVTGEARKRVQFRTLFLSNGEKTLEGHMKEAGKNAMAGMEVRLVNIPADCGEYGIYCDLLGWPDSHTLNEYVREAATTSYGTAFPAFIKNLVVKKKAVLKAIRLMIDRFVERNVEEGADGQIKRVAKRFGLVAAAGALATGWGITGWGTNEAQDAAEFCFKKWMEQRGGADRTEEIRLVNQVRAFFEAHGASRFTDCTVPGYGARVTPNRVGYKKTNSDGETYYIVFPEQFKKEICQGYDPSAATKILDKHNIIHKGSDGKFATPCSIPGEKSKKRMYVIYASVIADHSS